MAEQLPAETNNDQRWEIAPGIFVGEDYYWKRSDGWQWDGRERWWEYYVEITGMNGAGGLWIREKSRWNGTHTWHFTQTHTLSYEKSCELIAQITANLKQRDAA